MSFDDLIKANAAGYATPGLQKKIGYKYTTADGSNNVPMSEPGGHSAVSWANIFRDFNTGATRTPNTVAQINAGKPNVTQTAVSQILSSSPALAGAANDFQPIKFDLSGGLPPAPNLSALNTGVNTAQRWSGNDSRVPLTPIASDQPQQDQTKRYNLFGAKWNESLWKGDSFAPGGLLRGMFSKYGHGSSFTPLSS